MKIVLCDDSRGGNAWTFIRLGLARAFAACGHDISIWDLHSRPAIELMDELNPDLVILQSYNLERGIIKSIESRPDLKVILTLSDWSKYSDEIDIEKYPIVRVNKSELKYVEQIKNRINFGFSHYHQNSMQKTHHYWNEKMGISLVGLPPAADIQDYCNSEYKEEFKSDICFVGGYWPKKGEIINKWFFPLCDSSLGLNIKVFGNRGWPLPNYCGSIDTRHVKNVFKSAKLNVNLSEPHAHSVGSHEINERTFKILAGKNQLLSDYTQSLAIDFFPNGEIEFAKTPQEFKEKCLSVINGDLKVDTQKGYDEVMKRHTYFQRVESIFTHLNLPVEAENVRSVYQKIRKDNSL